MRQQHRLKKVKYKETKGLLRSDLILSNFNLINVQYKYCICIWCYNSCFERCSLSECCNTGLGQHSRSDILFLQCVSYNNVVIMWLLSGGRKPQNLLWLSSQSPNVRSVDISTQQHNFATQEHKVITSKYCFMSSKLKIRTFYLAIQLAIFLIELSTTKYFPMQIFRRVRYVRRSCGATLLLSHHIRPLHAMKVEAIKTVTCDKDKHLPCHALRDKQVC